MKYKCPDCNNETIIKVAEQTGTNFYSCHTKDCDNYAQMLMNVGNDGEYLFIRFDDMFNGMKQVLQDESNGDGEHH